MASDDCAALHLQRRSEETVLGRERLGEEREPADPLVPLERPRLGGDLA